MNVSQHDVLTFPPQEAVLISDRMIDLDTLRVTMETIAASEPCPGALANWLVFEAMVAFPADGDCIIINWQLLPPLTLASLREILTECLVPFMDEVIYEIDVVAQCDDFRIVATLDVGNGT